MLEKSLEIIYCFSEMCGFNNEEEDLMLLGVNPAQCFILHAFTQLCEINMILYLSMNWFNVFCVINVVF